MKKAIVMLMMLMMVSVNVFAQPYEILDEFPSEEVKQEQLWSNVHDIGKDMEVRIKFVTAKLQEMQLKEQTVDLVLLNKMVKIVKKLYPTWVKLDEMEKADTLDTNAFILEYNKLVKYYNKFDKIFKRFENRYCK